MKILIVEDDFVSRLALQSFLKYYGDTHVAVNGKEALEAFSRAHDDEAPYDLICLDIMMPVMNGLEALEVIRELEKGLEVPSDKQVKVIMTTAMDDPRTVLDSFHNLGAYAYLVKPIEIEDLRKTLRELDFLKE